MLGRGRTARVGCAGLAVWATLSVPVRGDAAAPERSSDTSEIGRRRVRGGRPPGASIHVAWVAPAHDPDRDHLAALGAFERATLPPSTIVTQPPKPWMAALDRPALPVRWNPRTIEYLRYFKDDPKGQLMIRAWMRRAGRYEARLRKILDTAGVPPDLVMVALAESGFNPRVRSRAGAGGLWQFMEGTAAVYGLSRDYWVDERFDVEKSTVAAASYLKDLRTRFGSWELALAAYNAGYGLIMTTIERYNSNNFWALSEIESGLPYATVNYVPKILAASVVGRNRAAFDVEADDIGGLSAVDWVVVKVPKSTRLKTLAKAIGADADLVAELNAHLVRGRTPPRRGRFGVRIPRNKLEAFKRAHPRLTEAWSSERSYTVADGEKLSAVARKHGITQKQLRRLNGVRDSAEVVGGVTLVVPVRTEIAAPTSPPPPPPLAAVPPLRPSTGQRVVFFVTTRATTPRTLEKGFGVRYADVVAWNDLDAHSRIQSDLVLQLLVSAKFDARAHGVRIYERDEVEYVIRGSREHLVASLRRRGKVRRGYKVRKGDNLTKIGRRFGLSVGDLARINGFGRSRGLMAAEVVVVYVDEGKTRGTVDAPAPRTAGLRGRAVPSPAQPRAARSPARPTRPPSTSKTSRVPGRR